MKPRLTYYRRIWRCLYAGVVGTGATPAEAWDDMCRLFKEIVEKFNIKRTF